MNRDQAVKEFREVYTPRVSPSGRIDVIAHDEAWGVYIDALCKEGRISQAQYEQWEAPPARRVVG